MNTFVTSCFCGGIKKVLQKYSLINKLPSITFLKYAGLNYNDCVKKMRLLTLASLAEECRDIPFATLTAELNLSAEELEMFVVEGKNLILFYVNYYFLVHGIGVQ